MGAYSKQVGAVILTDKVSWFTDPMGINTWTWDLPVIPEDDGRLADPWVWQMIIRMSEMAARDEITVLVDWPGWSLDDWRTALAPLRDLGWSWLGEIGEWTRFHRPRHASVNLGLVAEMEPRKLTLWSADETPQTIVGRLARYQSAIGAAWYINAGVSGCQSIRARYASPGKGEQPYWGTRDRWYSSMPGGAGDLQHWERDPDLTEQCMKWVHCYDANRARLAAAGNAELAWGRLKPGDPQPFDPGYSGYWQIRAHPEMLARIDDPVIVPPFGRDSVNADGLAWLSTPVMKYWADLGVTAEITATALEEPRPWGERSRSRRLLREWARTLDNAVTIAHDTGDVRLETALKLSYKITFGMISREGGSIFRTDWSDTVLDLGRINIIRRAEQVLMQVYRWPLRLHTDALYYASNEPDPAKAVPLLGAGTKLGTYKHATIPMAEWLDGRRK